MTINAVRVPFVGMGFNPCFGGSYIVTQSVVCDFYLAVGVSILVLVDLIL